MRVRLALVPVAIAAALVGGCATTGDPAANPSSSTTQTSNGVADLTADEILAKAKTALAAAKSFHVKGETTEEGAAAKIDMKFAGKDFAGTVESAGMTLELVRVGADLYMKAPVEFWQSFVPKEQQAALALLNGKYVKVDATSPDFSAMANAFNTDELVKPEGTVSKGEAKTINGTPAIGLVDSKDNAVLYIATVGEPLPLKAEGPSGTGSLEFTEYNATFDIKAPAAAEVFDLKSIMGG
ncbi:MAG TPA: hypothetical protein VF163_02540 [Micromonosporaceae bacterium]